MADTEFYLSLEDDSGFLALEDVGLLLLETSYSGTLIQNTTAQTRDQSGFTVCDRSGRKARPDELVRDPYTGGMVLPKYVDGFQPQEERPRRHDTTTKGSPRPEKDTLFITVTITVDDL
jgi:hypothetical protein